MAVELTVIISASCAILGAFIGIATFKRNGDKAIADKAKTDEIKAEQKEQRRTNQELITRMTAVEASAKQAHKRLDRMEGKTA